MIGSVALSTIAVSNESSHLDSERMRRSVAAQAAFFMRQPSPLIIAGLALATLAFRLSMGGLSLFDLALAAAVATYWPLQEWFLHKHLLHLEPFTVFGIRVDPHFSRAHRAHHRQPWTVEYTFLPMHVVIALVPISVSMWIILTPTVQLALTGMVTYSTMALLYEWTHYLTHSAYVPRSAYYRRIWKNHRLHHFKNERFWFGFTVPAVDTLLRTDPDHETVPKSETVRTLGIDD